MYKNRSDKFKTQPVIYKFKLTKTYVQSHISRVEPYTVKLTTQITSINTRFNITIICMFLFFVCCQTAPIRVPNSSSKGLPNTSV